MESIEKQRPAGRKWGATTSRSPDISRGAVSQLRQIQIWQNHHIVGNIQHLEDAGKVGENVNILINSIGGRIYKITTVARQGNEEMQRRRDFSDDSDRGGNAKTMV